MPIPVSAEFTEIVSGPHTTKGRLDVEANGVIVEQLYPTDCTISVDSASDIRRKITVKFVDDTGEYTPQGAADRYNPTAGTILRPYIGVEIPGTQQIGITVDTQEQWEDGTLTDIAVSPGGSISIA